MLNTQRESVTGARRESCSSESVDTDAGLTTSNNPREYMSEESETGSSGKDVGAGMAIGLAIGVAIGSATDNLGLWLAIGVALGAAIGAGLSNRE